MSGEILDSLGEVSIEIPALEEVTVSGCGSVESGNLVVDVGGSVICAKLAAVKHVCDKVYLILVGSVKNEITVCTCCDNGIIIAVCIAPANNSYAFLLGECGKSDIGLADLVGGGLEVKLGSAIVELNGVSNCAPACVKSEVTGLVRIDTNERSGELSIGEPALELITTSGSCCEGGGNGLNCMITGIRLKQHRLYIEIYKILILCRM